MANNGIIVNTFDQSPMANSNLNNMHSTQDADKDQAKRLTN